ncbi:hypothetical protein [Spongiactinospora sp. TRM90649]|uniref:hypothetical protein n=1 Tax=Spongiactinospora sp. TRM90649 TaxID=3031114 RepID=UPI0023F7D49D|nr:hypothetical protein [Spongiactinospora sp. TRM90649]MDF5756642.1 hypothetical protein [Spongiactinospora sp. TRM90649]
MADFQFNIAKGRAVELYRRVKAGDPATSALLVVVLAATGVESDAVLRDKDTLADVLSGSTDEASNTGYARKVLGAADLAVPAPDDANDWASIAISDQTWLNVQAGSNWSKVLICYRPATASPDSAVIPMTSHDFPIIPDGSNVVAQVDLSGFFRAV